MDESTYQSAVTDLNGALQLAGISTLTSVLLHDQVIDGKSYAHVIAYSGSYLSADAHRVSKIVLDALARYGEFSGLKRPHDAGQVLPPPTATDHYVLSYGYYVSNSDVEAAILTETQISGDLQAVVADAKVRVQNIGTKNKYTVTSLSGTATISDLNPSNDRSVTLTVNATYHLPTP